MYSLHEWETLEVVILGCHKDVRSLKEPSCVTWTSTGQERPCHLKAWWWPWAGEGEHALCLGTCFGYDGQWWHYFEMRKTVWTSGSHSVGKMHWLWNIFMNCEVLSHVRILKTVWVRECSVRQSCTGCETAGMIKMCIGVYICWDNLGKVSWIAYPLSFDRGCFADVFNENRFLL